MNNRYLYRLFIILLTVVMLVGVVPVSAASSGKSYETQGETIILTSENTTYNIPAGSYMKKIIARASSVSIVLHEYATIKNLVVGKKNCKLNIYVDDMAYVSIDLKKKADLEISGRMSADTCDVKVGAAGCTVTSSIPVNVTANKDVKVSLNRGAEGYKIKKGKSTVKVTLIDNTSEKAAKTSLPAPTAQKKTKKLFDSAEKYLTTTLTLRSDQKLLYTKEEVREYIYNHVNNYTGFYMFVKSLDLISDESYYMDIFPSIASLEFSEPQVYKNCACVKITASKKLPVKDDELYAVDNALSNGYTGYLSSNEKELYELVIDLAKKLKGKTEYDTVKNIHDYLVKTIAYSNNVSGNVYSARNALVKKACVCQGYGLAFYEVAKAAGIDVIYVTGTAYDKNNNSEAHGWNKVKIEGRWYSIDCTWDDPTPYEPGRILYTYFLLADEDMAYDHAWDNEKLPVAVSRDLGTIYTEYEDTLRFNSDQKAYDYIFDNIEKTRSKSPQNFKYEIDLITPDNGNVYYDAVKNLLDQYHEKFGYGTSLSSKNLGFYGTLFHIKVYKGTK